MLNRSLLFSLALLLTVDAGNYLNANENNKIIYEKIYHCFDNMKVYINV